MAFAATVTTIEQAQDGVKLWATQPATKQVVDQIVSSLQTGRARRRVTRHRVINDGDSLCASRDRPILGALEYGERIPTHEYREKRNLVIELASRCDEALQQLTLLRERMDGTAMPREGLYRRRRDDR